MLQGIQPDACSDGGRSSTRRENDFDLRGVNSVRTFDCRAVCIGGVDGHAELGSGVGGGKEDVLLQAALRRDGWRNAAESNITGISPTVAPQGGLQQDI